METKLPDYNLWLMVPEIILFGWALLVFTYDLMTKRKSAKGVIYLAMAGPVVTGLVMWALAAAEVYGYGRGFGNMFFNDPLALFFKVIFLGAAFMAIGSSFGVIRERIVNHRGEFFGLILLSTVGMMFLASSNELLSLYIGLELTTIPLFVLAAFFKDDRLSVEAGIKYLIVGAFSSALLLYGLSFLYGLSGTTEILQMKVNIAILQLTNGGDIGVILILATGAILAGLGFKLALPPFHQWAPDVYEGAPTPVASFLSVGSKAAGLVAFAKIMVNGLFAFYDPVMSPNDWGIIAGVLAIAGMIIGNVLAIRQTNIKRMLAYSSIAQAGYVMVGMVAVNELGLAAMSFYMFAYLFSNMGAFAVIAIIEEKTGSCEIDAYNGLSRRSPFLAATLSVFLLSLTGIPPLAGFLAKYYVFAAAIKMAATDPSFYWLYWVVGIGLLTSVFALYYYAGIMRAMYFNPTQETSTFTASRAALIVVVVGLIGVVLLGLYPEPIMKFAQYIPAAYGLTPPQ